MPGPYFTSFSTNLTNSEYESVIRKYFTMNMDRRQFDVYAYSREEYNAKKLAKSLPKESGSKTIKYVVFDKDYSMPIDKGDLIKENQDLINKLDDIVKGTNPDFNREDSTNFNTKELAKALFYYSASTNLNKTKTMDEFADYVNKNRDIAIRYFIGNGDLSNCFNYFYDNKLLAQNTYALDLTKVNGFVSSLNKELESLGKTLTNKNSEFNKFVNYNKLKDVNVQSLEDQIKKAYPKDRTTSIIEFANTKTTPPTKEATMDLVKTYIQLKTKVDNYTIDLKEEKATQYIEEKNAIMNLKPFLQNVCRVNIDSINLSNYELEKKEYLDRSVFGNPSHDIYNLEKTRKEYDSHNILWKIFLGGKIRSHMDDLKAKALESGVNKELVNILRDGKTDQKSFEKAYNSIRSSSVNLENSENKPALLASLNKIFDLSDDDFKTKINETINEIEGHNSINNNDIVQEETNEEVEKISISNIVENTIDKKQDDQIINNENIVEETNIEMKNQKNDPSLS